MIYRLIPLFLYTGVSILTGCYLDRGDEESFPEYQKTGILIDSPVSAMTYRINGGAEKKTNFEGKFSYKEGDLIRFYIGDYGFPAVVAQETITPMTLAGVNDINDRRVINIAFILQALDADQNPDNGIEIIDSLYGATFDFNFDQDFNDFLSSFDVDELIWSYLAGKAPRYEDVVDHLQRQLGLRGSWVDASGATLNFLQNSEVLYINADGYEYGQYNVDSITGLITVSIGDDFNGDSGFGPQTQLTAMSISSDALTFTVDDNDFSFTRTEDSHLGLADSWFYQDADTGDRYFLILFANDTYQLVRVSTDDGGSVDTGSYNVSSTGLRLTSSVSEDIGLGVLSFEVGVRQFTFLLSDRELTISLVEETSEETLSEERLTAGEFITFVRQ